MNGSTISLKHEDRHCWVTLNRPPLNILNIPLLKELDQAIEAAGQQADLLIFTGSGEKAFSAGVDVADHVPERVADMLHAFHQIFRKLWMGEVVTIAAVRGYCLGGGCELATFCDFVLAEETATFGFPEITLGCFPPVALVTLPRLIGARAALELILTGRTLSAAEAQQLGLLTRVVPAGGLEKAVTEVVASLERLSPTALRMTRSEAALHAYPNFDEELEEVEDFYLTELMETADAIEGVRAFLEKRAPVWSPRRPRSGS